MNFKALFEGDNRPIEGHSQRAAPSSACYVVYTSGSTGTPKRIVVSHRNAATFSRDFQHRFGITSETRTLQVLNFIFDASIGCMLCTLMHGGAVCLSSETQLADDMGAAFRHFHASFANMTPTQSSLFRPEDVVGTLRNLALGGEPLPAKVVEIWAGHVRLINVYGPSETTVWSSSRDVTVNGTNPDSRNIGHAAGCRYWVVQSDNHDRLFPIGCPDELLIEGPLVSRGYLNDPQKTSTVFLDHPPLWTKHFPNLEFGERFYKSRDLVTQDTRDGSILYLDRKDTQVKLWGQRIELGDIEHHLTKLIDDARWTLLVELVQPSDQDQTKAYLAVFYVTPAEIPPRRQERSGGDALLLQPMTVEMTELRQQAFGVLPEYMVPSVYYHLRKIPRTASGKTDRKFLRRMTQTLLPEEVAAYHAVPSEKSIQQSVPSSEKQTSTTGEGTVLSQGEKHPQAVLRSLWSSILHIDAASIAEQDSFFRLGGNSVTAIHLVAVARDEGYSISVAQIFRNECQQEQTKVLSPVIRKDNAGLDIMPFSLSGNTV